MTPRPPRAALLAFAVLASLPLATAGAQAAAANPAANAAVSTAPRRTSTGWTGERREFVVGDVLTVQMDESTLSSVRKEQVGTDDTSRDLDLGIDPPQLEGSSLPAIDARVRARKNSRSNQRGDARRDIDFISTMSVRVTAIDPRTGLLQVRGTRQLDLDKARQELVFTGWVRPHDVTALNMVPSARVADAKLVMKLKGNVGKTRGGIIGRIIGGIWP